VRQLISLTHPEIGLHCKPINLLVNFREYVLKIALTRSIFQPKMHQIAFGGRAPPDLLAEIWDLLLRGDGRKEKGRGGRRG